MSKKAKPTTAPPKPAVPVLKVNVEKNEARERAIARTLLRPSVTGAVTIHRAMRRLAEGEPDFTLTGLIDELSAQCAEASKGNLARPEAMLMTQSHTLDALFHDLTQLAYNNLNQFDVAERLFRLAFRAQGQSRANIEALGALKNPPMVFAKQANVTSGPQQVNNSHFQNSTRARARENDLNVSELLEQTSGEWLETGEAGSAGRRDKELETVGTLDGTANG